MRSSASHTLHPGSKHLAYDRKQKSLGRLCSNFISLYNRNGVELISLDDAARRLGVERRRIYDIVNILESIGVLVKKGKNTYYWIGFSGMPKALERLEEEACGEVSRNGGFSVKEDYEDDLDESRDHFLDDGDNKLTQSPINSSATADVNCKTICATVNRREKSLSVLTENFIKLFLTSDCETISLDGAAKLLLGASDDAFYMRTKVRRLYDIANVLSSINLIEKVQLESRKPAFRWLGTKGKMMQNNILTVDVPPSPEKFKKRAFGTEITNVHPKKSRFNSAVDKKSVKVEMPSEDLEECNRIPKPRLSYRNVYSFGPFHPIGMMKFCPDTAVKCGNEVQEWESLAASFRPPYRNQALSELFAHYTEAWRTWYADAIKGNYNMQQHISKLFINEAS